jgi:uncharacterized protein (UPF0332 family)
MILSDEQRKDLVAIRMAKAEDALADASTLVDRGSCSGAINRCYYAMFHAVSALAIRDNCDFHKHRAVISWFSREYIKTGRVSRELGKSLRLAFDQRCDADYSDVIAFTASEVGSLLEQTRRFLAEVKSLLQGT